MIRRGINYGQKGGEGKTRGRKASVYQGVLPNGTKVTVKSMLRHTDNAVIAWYEHEGVQYPNGAWDADDLPDWIVARKRYVPATRIKAGA